MKGKKAQTRDARTVGLQINPAESHLTPEAYNQEVNLTEATAEEVKGKKAQTRDARTVGLQISPAESHLTPEAYNQEVNAEEARGLKTTKQSAR